MAPPPCVEFIKIVVNDDYTDDPKVSKPGLEALLKAPGCIATYIGREEYDADNLFLINAWESLKQHEDFKAQTQSMSVKDGFTLVMKSLTYLFHVYFTEEPYTALSAPLTEVTVFTVKEEFSNEEFVPILATLVETLNGITTRFGGCGGATWGTVVESKREYVLITGWNDLESWRNYPPSLVTPALFIQLNKYSHRDVRHVVLSKFVS